MINLGRMCKKYFLKLGFGVAIMTLLSCSATIYRLPEVNGSSADKFATIIIPNDVLLVRINAFRFGHCFRDGVRKCGLQLIPGEYILSVRNVTNSTRIDSLTVYSAAGSNSFTNAYVTNQSSLTDNKISTTLKNNSYYGFIAASSG